ncbi:MAG: hypothetical protein A3A08_00365 [Candidatus Nealsonbacteria bacterium RIFCSPLOWO2_01_FULL_41_9]|uniref:Uncharacterized protein n=1 Tax=Candidatus Nealsonbacteria bacterium RIFCSPLOWO2_01_FULL_41_9 TaxID=1801671 RepID=A0A1G2ECG3_9BACT|nr:MAG: hypothetical protein A3A08_00365 [Candidatus Nealsonbacteria bacterium RIFCSPLOWO2_01_FULL_41_9]
MIIQIIFLFLFCLVLAALETQIEGGAGWAQNLPTWRPAPDKLISRLYGKIMGGRELTLYHILVFTLVLVFLHYPYFAGKLWSLSSELTTLSFFFLVIVIWDFLWFVVNPRYDFRRFWGKHVLWHKKWFLHMPADYWFALIISALLYTQLSLRWELLKEWLAAFALFCTFTLIVVIAAIFAGIFNIKEEFKK